jgi:hypothetical protein
MIGKEDINYSIEKFEFSREIRKSLQYRIKLLQIITIFLIIYLITFPVFDYLNNVIKHPNITFREEGIILLFLFFFIVFSLFLMINTLREKIHINKYIFLFIIISLIITEINPFWLSFKFTAAIFFYEIPFIIRYYSEVFNGYQTYSFQQILEFNRLRMLLDKHVGHLLTLAATMIGSTWILIIISDRIIVDLGNEAGVTIPLIILVIVAILIYFRPDVSNTLTKYQKKEEEG